MSPSMSKLVQNSFSTLSTALLKEIFDCLCNNEPVYLPLRPSEPRYIVSLVCKRWFNIVRSTCSFWDKVHFTKPPPHTTAHESHPLLKHFAFCVALSGQNSLTINVDMVCDGWAFSLVRSIIIPHIHRIKVLSCPMYGNRDIITFLTIPEGNFSILESVEIWFINTPTRPASSFSLDVCLQFEAFRTAPRLRKATMHLSNGLHPIDIRLPWAQLAILDLGTTSMPPGVFIKIMHSTAQRLKDAFFNIRFTKLLNPRLVLWKASVKMKALKTLRLRLLFPSQDTRLFSCLQLPSLQNLSIEMHDRFQDWDIALYTKLLRASARSLQKLNLVDYPTPESTETGLVVRRRHCETSPVILERLFKVIPNIQKLHLPLGLDVHASTVEKMATYALLPRLDTLEQVGTVDGWSILSMARRRHMHFLDISLVDKPEFETGSSQQPIKPPKQLGHLGYVYLLVPRRGYDAEEKKALVQEAQALTSLGVICHLQSTEMLPLPIMKPRTLDRWVTQPSPPA